MIPMSLPCERMGLALLVSLATVACSATGGTLSPGGDPRPGGSDGDENGDMGPDTRQTLLVGSGTYAGLYSIGSVASDYARMIQKSGGTAPALVFSFHNWNIAPLDSTTPTLQTFTDPMENEDLSPLELGDLLAEDGRILALAWDCIGYFFEHPDYFTGGGVQAMRYVDILAGAYDDYLRTTARQLREWGKPIMLSPFGEFNSIGSFSFGQNGNDFVEFIPAGGDLTRAYGDPMKPDGPERVRDTMRYIIDFFARENVTTVTWFMYSHSGYMNPDVHNRLDALHPRHYYPGDGYVQWIGNSAYVVDGSRTEDFDDLQTAIGSALAAWSGIADLPFFIPELGVVHTDGADRVARLRRLFSDELPRYPRVNAFTFADAALFAEYFAIPLLGDDPAELPIWRETVIDNAYYSNEPVLGQRPRGD